jgi:flagella basal body P-ring formation protein FlgA
MRLLRSTFAALLVAAGAAARPIVAEVGARVTAQPSAGSTFGKELLLAELTRAVGAQYSLEGELQLELIRTWTPPARSATVWDLQVLEYPNAPATSMMLRCRLLGDGAPVLETTFVVRAQLWRDAWSTRQPIANGATFDAAALEVRRIDALRDRDALPASVGDRGFVFARAVSASRLLTWRDVARRPLVRKGDFVEVSAIDGRLAVTMKAVAMQSGAQGETVTVRNPESRKDFSALVVDENRVQVRF